MADESGAGGWWGGWLQAAREKSTEAITFIRRDLEEFTAVVQSDTRNLVASTTNSIRDHIALTEPEANDSDAANSNSADASNSHSTNASSASADAVSNSADTYPGSADAPSGGSSTSPLAMLGISEDEMKEVTEFASKTGEYVSKGFSSFLSSVSQALIIPPDDDDEDPIVFKEDGMIFNRTEARLHCLRVDPLTYSEEPEGPSYVYERWLDENDLEKQKADIANLLIDCTEMRAHYTQMVPTVVSHAQFWSRYFFKLEQMEAEEKRREALKARADNATKAKDDADDLGWGDEEEEEEEQEEKDGDLISLAPTVTGSAAGSTDAPTATKPPSTQLESSLSSNESSAAAYPAISAASLLTPDLFEMKTNPVAAEELSAAQIDSLLSMEDEMRNGEKKEADADAEKTSENIDPKLVDKLLEQEASLSPRKIKKASSERPIVEMEIASAGKEIASEAEDIASAEGDIATAIKEIATEAEMIALAERESAPAVACCGKEGEANQETICLLNADLVKETDAELEKDTSNVLSDGAAVENAVESDCADGEGNTSDVGMGELNLENLEVANTVEEADENKAEYQADNVESIKGLIIVDGVDEDSAIASRTTPTPTPSSKESAASGDDWEKELELDLTEAEKTMAEKLLTDGDKLDDDWENWE